MLAYDSFEDFVSSMSSVQQEHLYDKKQREPEPVTIDLRQEILEKLAHEFGLASRRVLEKFFQRLIDSLIIKDEDRHIFLFSPEEFASKIQGLDTRVLLFVLNTLIGETSTLRRNLHPMQSDCYDAEQGEDEFMDLPLMESSSDSDWREESESEMDEGEIELEDQEHAKALVMNPFNTQKYRNAPEEQKDGWKKVKAVVDTGASHFITADQSMLTNQRTSKTMISTAESGGTLQAKARGTVNMEFDNQARTPFLKTTDAIYSPNCSEETLIPARQVCHNGNLIGIIYTITKLNGIESKIFESVQSHWVQLGWMGRRTYTSRRSGLNRMIRSLLS